MAASFTQFSGAELLLFGLWFGVILWPIYYSIRHKTSLRFIDYCKFVAWLLGPSDLDTFLQSKFGRPVAVV